MPSAAVSFHRQIVFGAYLKQNFFTCQGRQEERERDKTAGIKEKLITLKYLKVFDLALLCALVSKHTF